ncbi:hypothetical protein GYMLUDRAFT_251372 [Collybiopsis luxurians FD-317 M1]|uniref:Ankyrin n=1 Tax=Collybiopsis luxurians FD-317 M1 TaxID=944289 RepID=A0A0D0BCL5_9AGAR|nr:hypothetical protein GYMLUDRAFT_251372 [Collybiopsis luxurians FD-317 M1]
MDAYAYARTHGRIRRTHRWTHNSTYRPPRTMMALTRESIERKYAWADYENFFLLPASPLSRAVMMESLPAVRTLLSLGADPLEGLAPGGKAKDPMHGLSVCPVAVASVLCLPDILEVLLAHLDATTLPKPRLFSEIQMLEMALDCAVTIGDPMSLDRRVTRHGPKYKSSLISTLRILHEREGLFIDEADEATKTVAAKASAVMRCRLTVLGRTDIVETLLSLGHSANGFTSGTDHILPIVTAVEQNHEAIFRLLLDHGADVNVVLSQQPNRSLLQILAERPKQSRNGIGIAQLLIAKGIPIDPMTLSLSSSSTDNTTTQPLLLTPKSAFSSAVTRQDFPLADLLLTHGANIELVHMWNPIRPPTTPRRAHLHPHRTEPRIFFVPSEPPHPSVFDRQPIDQVVRPALLGDVL